MNFATLIVIIVLVVAMIILAVFFSLLRLWVQCLLGGANISILDLIRM